MKKYSKMYYGLSVFVVTALFATAPAFAADDTRSTQTTTTDTSTIQSGDMKSASTMRGGFSILGSNLIGKNVKNPQGETLGEIKDIMLDSKGKVRYVAVTYGGFLGIGDKIHAVPLSAFQFQRDKDMFFDDTELILNVTKEQLADEPGFDANNWPDLDNETYRTDLDRRYNVKRSDKK